MVQHKRFFTGALALVLSLAILAPVFAAGQQDAGEGEEPAQTVEIWSWRSQDELVWEAVTAELQDMGENIVVDYRNFVPTEYDSKLLASLQGGSGPDIMYTRRLPGNRTQALIDNGYLVPLDDEIDLSNFTDATLGFIQSGGQTWGIPFANQIVGIFYNTAIFDEHGFEEPETWDELVAIAEELEANDVTPFALPGRAAWVLAMQHAMTGVSVPGEEWIGRLIEGDVKFNDPAMVDLNTKLMDLSQYYQDDFMANNAEEQDALFAFEEAAMVFYGIWAITTWKELNPEIEVGYFPVPPASTDVPARAYVYMDGSFALNSDSDVPEAAMKVLEYSATPDFGTIFAEVTGEMTAVANVDMPPENELLVEAYELSTSIASENIYWVGSPFQRGTPTPYDILQEGMQAMYLGDITPEELADRLQEGVSEWYEPLQ